MFPARRGQVSSAHFLPKRSLGERQLCCQSCRFQRQAIPSTSRRKHQLYWAMAAALDLHREVALPVPLHKGLAPSVLPPPAKKHVAIFIQNVPVFCGHFLCFFPLRFSLKKHKKNSYKHFVHNRPYAVSLIKRITKFPVILPFFSLKKLHTVGSSLRCPHRNRTVII